MTRTPLRDPGEKLTVCDRDPVGDTGRKSFCQRNFALTCGVCDVCGGTELTGASDVCGGTELTGASGGCGDTAELLVKGGAQAQIMPLIWVRNRWSG
jgi:hypothetical protein